VAVGGQTVPPEIEAPAAARTILLVEDNLSNAKLVEKVIERVPGVRLLTVREGGDALELALHSTPDLILLDLDLPDLSGEEVLRRLCEEPATGEIPVVVVSADARCEAIERLLAAGALDYLTKPIDVDRLLDVVAKA
jgi:CheY-like chemotaxis protein